MAQSQIVNRWSRPMRAGRLARREGRRTQLMLWLTSAASLGLVAVCAYVVTHAQ